MPDSGDRKYVLRYLPLFASDLDEAAAYISSRLNNPAAADKLIADVEKAILERVPFAESFEPYVSARRRKLPYYRIYVGNYVIYYVVYPEDDEFVMEIRRMLYKRREREKNI